MSGQDGRACLVVPVKGGGGSKQRLASQLPDGARLLLSRALATRTLRCAAETWPSGSVVVVGDDPEVADLCRRQGLEIVPDGGEGQSEAVRIGQARCLRRGATVLATVAADLPTVAAEDLAELRRIAETIEPSSLAVIPDRSRTGSNGLVLNPAHLDPFFFGPGSLQRHRAAAQRLGLRFSILELPRLTWDVDRLEDLEAPETSLAEGAHPVLEWARAVASMRGELAHGEVSLGD